MQLEEFLHGGTYVPKVGMCTACKYRGSDCSGLDFAAMPLIKTIEGFKKKYIVICTSYKHRVSTDIQTPNNS